MLFYLISLSAYLSLSLPILLPSYPSTYLPNYLFLFTYFFLLSTYLSIDRSIYVSLSHYLCPFLSIFFSLSLSLSLSPNLCIILLFSVSPYLSIYRSIYLSLYLYLLSIHPSRLNIQLPIRKEAIMRDFLGSKTMGAILRGFLKRSHMVHLQDLLTHSNWQHQKQSDSARLAWNGEVRCRGDDLVQMRFVIFHPMFLK